MFLDVDFSVTVPRAVERDSATPEDEVRQIYAIRYVPGQRLYLSAEQPSDRASLLIDNSDPGHPVVVRAG
jgi:uridine kinase